MADTLVHWYIQCFRNTPPLVQLYFFYFGLGFYLRAPDAQGALHPVVGSVTWAIIALHSTLAPLMSRFSAQA